MFWEKKEKEKGLPDLPRAPARPSIPPKEYSLLKSEDELEDEEVHELPSFPDSPMQRGFSQSVIKDAVANEEVKENSPLYRQTTHPSYKFVEMEEWTPQERTKIPSAPVSMPGKRDNKPIFVRIDKFQLARNSLETVKTKLSEIEELLKTIREVKAKEDAELSSWESEMENVKSRVQNVLNDIFERAEN